MYTLTLNDRKLIEETKSEIKSELIRLKLKINNFIAIEFLSVILTLTFIFNQLEVFYTIPTLYFTILAISSISQIVLIMAIRVAIYNWKCSKGALICYEMSDSEINRKFNNFLKKSD